MTPRKLKYVSDTPTQVIVYNKFGKRVGHIRRALFVWTFFPCYSEFPYFFGDEMISIGRKLSSLNKELNC